MQITAIKFTEDEEKQLFDTLVERFDLTNSNVFEKGQEIEFRINELIECTSFLELYAEGYIEPETNACIFNSQSVVKFELYFWNEEGEEVKAKLNNKSGESIYDKISEYYRK
jgi:hypothetical protein